MLSVYPSRTQYLFPETIKDAPLDPPRAPSGRFFGPSDYRRRFPDGRIGSNPGLATPEKGKRYHEYQVDVIVRFIKWLREYRGPLGRTGTAAERAPTR